MAITPLPPAPSRAVPSTFSAKADAFLGALPTFVTEANALEANVNAKEVIVTAQANAANIAMAAANFKGEWSALSGAATVPYCVSHDNMYWMLTTNIADITAKEPGVASEWISIGAGADLITAGLAHAIDGIGVLGKEIENIRLRVLMTGQVTITNANTGQPHWLMTTALTSNVTLSRNLPNANYTVLVEVEDADDKDRVGEIKISSKAINGFTITVTGNTNNIDLRWTVVDPNFWTR
jgi:hypothetical protein